MNEPIETIDYKGLKIKIYQDENYEGSPDDDGNEEVFLVAYHRDFWVDRKHFITKEVAVALANREYDDHYQKSWCENILKHYWVFGLEAYIHSGVVLALSKEGNFCDRQWDVSQLGLVFVSKKEARLNSKARKLALGLIENWNSCLSGEIYGFVVEDKDGEELDSCWGFVGDIKYCEADAIAGAELVYQMLLKKRQEQVKTYIRNKVPLGKRVQFSL